MSSPPSSERLVVQPQENLAGRAACRYRAVPSSSSSSLSQLPSSFRPGFAVVLLLAILTSMILYDVEGGVTTRASTITLNASEPPLDVTSTAVDDANNRTYAASAIVSTISSSSTLVIRRRDDTVEEATPTASARIRHVTSAADLPPSDVRSPDTLTPPMDDRLRPNDVTVTLPNSSDSSTRDVDYNATTITTVGSAFSAENWTAQNRNGDVGRQSTYNVDAAGTSHSPSTPAVTPMTADTSTPSVVGRSTSGTADSIAGSGFDGGGSRRVDATTTTAETAASRTDSSRPQKPDVIDALTDDEDDEDDSTALVDDAKVQFAPLDMTSSGTSSAAAASRTRNDTVQQPHQRAFEPFAPDVLFQQRSPPVVPLSRQRGRVAGGPASSTSRWRQPPHTTSRSVRLDNSTDCDLGVLAEAVQHQQNQQQQVLRQPSSRRWNDGGTSILPEGVVYTFVLASLAPAHVSSSSSSSVNSFAESFNFSLSGFGLDDDVIIDAFLHLRVGVELPSPAARRSFIFVGVRLNGDDVTSVTVRKKFNRRRPLTPELCLRVGIADVIRSTLGQTGSGLLSVDIRLTGSSVGSVGGSRRRHHRLQQQQRHQHATDSRFVVRGTQGPFLSVKRHVCEDSRLPHRGP